jgi:hypothetical protein
MFAILLSLFYLERIGEIAHAHRNRIGLIEGAQRISRQEMLAVTQGPLSEGFTARPISDIEKWIASLTPPAREKAGRLVAGGC